MCAASYFIDCRGHLWVEGSYVGMQSYGGQVGGECLMGISLILGPLSWSVGAARLLCY
jgi:hypothetical protein